MPVSLGLRRASALAAFCVLAGLSCDSETIDLLPPDANHAAVAGNTALHSAGNTATAGTPPSGGAASGAAAAGGGNAGTAGAGGNVACIGAGCAGFTFGGLGGSFWSGNCNPEDNTCAVCQQDEQCPDRWHCSTLLGGLCVECLETAHCRPGFACDLGIWRCGPACEDSIDCDEGMICNPEQGTCVECLDHPDCDRDSDIRYCAKQQHICVECLGHADCDEGSRNICAGGHCTECVFDEQCGPDQYCDLARGHCEP